MRPAHTTVSGRQQSVPSSPLRSRTHEENQPPYSDIAEKRVSYVSGPTKEVAPAAKH